MLHYKLRDIVQRIKTLLETNFTPKRNLIPSGGCLNMQYKQPLDPHRPTQIITIRNTIKLCDFKTKANVFLDVAFGKVFPQYIEKPITKFFRLQKMFRSNYQKYQVHSRYT